MQIKKVNDTDFHLEVRESENPTVVMFTFEWCKPCKKQMPAIEFLADAFAGDINFVQMDIEESPVTARDLAVRQAPTLVLFNDGMVRSTLSDSTKTKLEIRQWINEEV